MSGVFQFDIFADEHFYSYGFTVSYQNAEIEEEWLYRIDDDESLLFERSRDENGKMRVISGMQFEDEDEKKRFESRLELYNSEEINRREGF